MRFGLRILCRLGFVSAAAAAVIFMTASGTGCADRKAGATPMMTLVLKPGPVDLDDRVGGVEVTITLPDIEAPADSPVFLLPLKIANVETAARTLQNFTAEDAEGFLPMETRDDPEDAPLPYRRWIISRPAGGDLVVSYRAPIDARPPSRSGPPFGLSSEGGGFSGAGNSFILMPASSGSYGLAIRWDLSALSAHAGACSSFGDGDVKIPEPGAPNRLLSAFFMAGPQSTYPETPPDDGFSSAWLGAPPFDPLPLMVWTEKLHSWYTDFFKPEQNKPYRVFLRFNPINPNGGVGLYNSFVATFDENTRAEDLKLLLAHEMFHTFSPNLADGSGNRPDSTQWFSEGLAIFYQRALPLRAGLIDPDVFLEDLNRTAARYYTNPLYTTPNGEIAARFWEDTRIRVLPYDRGSMYLAVVNDRIRKASDGKRSLDDIVLSLLARSRQGLGDTPDVWVELITAEYGPEAKTEYEAMLAGAVMLPGSDAFGPDFERRTRPLRRFELGFDPRVMNENPRIIRGLISGSAADLAGLRDRDEIVLPVGLDAVQEDQNRTLTLRIRREGEVFPVTYLPRGETVDCYQWVKKTGETGPS